MVLWRFPFLLLLAKSSFSELGSSVRSMTATAVVGGEGRFSMHRAWCNAFATSPSWSHKAVRTSRRVAGGQCSISWERTLRELLLSLGMVVVGRVVMIVVVGYNVSRFRTRTSRYVNQAQSYIVFPRPSQATWGTRLVRVLVALSISRHRIHRMTQPREDHELLAISVPQ